MWSAVDCTVKRTLNKRVRQRRTHPARAFKGSYPWRSPHQYTGPRRRSYLDWPLPNAQQILLRYFLLQRIDDPKYQLDFQLVSQPQPLGEVLPLPQNLRVTPSFDTVLSEGRGILGAQLLEELAKSYRTITTVGLVIGALGNGKNGNIVLTHHHRHHHHWFNVIFPRFSTDCTVSHEFHTSMLHDVSDW